mgnify:CR=1 FL=1
MTPVLVLTNHKGGVGKSTSATNIAFGLVNLLRSARSKNAKVLLVDTDSQGHATLVTTGRKNYDTHDSLYATLVADRKEAPRILTQSIHPSTWDPDLHVLPASPILETAERELIGLAGAPYRLADPLSKIRPHYAAIVIDTRPSFSLMTEMALLAATHAIIPVEPRYLETIGLMSALTKIQDIREGWRHPELKVNGILVTKMDKRIKGHRQLLDDLYQHPTLGKLVCGVIPANEAVSYSHHRNMSLFSYDHRAAASKAYAQLVTHLARQLLTKQV